MMTMQETKIEEKTEMNFCPQCARFRIHTVHVLYGVKKLICECGLVDFVEKVVKP